LGSAFSSIMVEHAFRDVGLQSDFHPRAIRALDSPWRGSNFSASV
jgi:hypothetical protein